MKSPVLTLRNVSKDFIIPTSRSPLRAVNQINLDLYEGEVFGIVGESGSGKTTLGRCAFGVVEPTSGEVFICGEPLHGRRSNTSKVLRSKLGFVYQDPQGSINPRLAIYDVIAEPLKLRGDSAPEIQSRIEFLMDRVGLKQSNLQKRAFELSGGQCQRVAIARAISTNPRIVLLDEPTSALDLSVQAQILNLLEELRSEFQLTYLMISHNLEVIGHFSDRVAVMKDGAFVEIGETTQVMNTPAHPYTQELLRAYSKTSKKEDFLPTG